MRDIVMVSIDHRAKICSQADRIGFVPVNLYDNNVINFNLKSLGKPFIGLQ